jgi:hypothetical protein
MSKGSGIELQLAHYHSCTGLSQIIHLAGRDHMTNTGQWSLHALVIEEFLCIIHVYCLHTSDTTTFYNKKWGGLSHGTLGSIVHLWSTIIHYLSCLTPEIPWLCFTKAHSKTATSSANCINWIYIFFFFGIQT